MASDPLALDRETMRRLGHQTVDMLVDRLSDDSAPPLRRATPAEMRRKLAEPCPESPTDFTALLQRLERDVLPFTSRGDHPGFLAFMPFCGTWPGALGDLIAAACNIYAGSWMESAGPTQLEVEVLGWFKDWLGYPGEAGGLLLNGGSTANMTALACARESLVGAMSDDLIGYVSDQAHSSLGRGARMLGFRPDQLRVLPVDASFRLDPKSLAAAMDVDLRAGRRPLFVSASAGATNTGAVDPLLDLAEVCRERGAWFHVDAAYGGFTALTERGRELLRGIERADSVTLDPHKWLFQPYECGCLLVRDDALLRDAFQMSPDYLQDAQEAEGEVNFCDRGIQLTRASRAIKVWLSLSYFGVGAFREAIDRAIDLAALAAERVERSRVLEPMAPPSLGVVCFRRRFPGVEEEELDRLNAGLVGAVERSGVGLISSTLVRGRYALRICVLNHTTRWEDVERVLGLLETADPGPVNGAAAYDRHDQIRVKPLRRHLVHAEQAGVPDSALENISLFAGLAARERERVAALARLSLHRTGETIVEQWEPTLDFYVVLDGTLRALVDGEPVMQIGPDEYFGELAALDWGAGFGYPRTASVVALSDVILLAFPMGSFNHVIRDHPAIAKQIRRTAHERLGQSVR